MKHSPADRTTSHISEWLDEPRPLTHDEKKAAEAAFRRGSFNPAWSQAARKVYNEISTTMVELQLNRRGWETWTSGDTQRRGFSDWN